VKNKLIEMNRKLASFTAITLAIFAVGCGSNSQDKPGAAAVADNTIGKGKFKEIKLTHPLDDALIEKGQTVHSVKCAACHKLTDEKLVGPGWKGVTDRRKPEWIMNFVTNTDEMIDKDPTAQALLEKCMVRMPNQHITDEEARNVLEFMRKNDGKE
jgi:mono/diheme cytochrome c family protein